MVNRSCIYVRNEQPHSLSGDSVNAPGDFWRAEGDDADVECVDLDSRLQTTNLNDTMGGSPRVLCRLHSQPGSCARGVPLQLRHLWALLFAFMNAASAVANEYAMKKRAALDINIHNIILYSLCGSLSSWCLRPSCRPQCTAQRPSSQASCLSAVLIALRWPIYNAMRLALRLCDPYASQSERGWQAPVPEMLAQDCAP